MAQTIVMVYLTQFGTCTLKCVVSSDCESDSLLFRMFSVYHTTGLVSKVQLPLGHSVVFFYILECRTRMN